MINNVVIIEGNLGKTPECKTLDKGGILTKVSMGIYRSEKVTDWVNLVAFGSEAETLGQAEKGSKVKVYGSLSVRTYEDKEGKKQTWTEVIVDNIKVYPKRTDSKSDAGSVENSEPAF